MPWGQMGLGQGGLWEAPGSEVAHSLVQAARPAPCTQPPGSTEPFVSVMQDWGLPAWVTGTLCQGRAVVHLPAPVRGQLGQRRKLCFTLLRSEGLRPWTESQEGSAHESDFSSQVPCLSLEPPCDLLSAH